VDGDVLGRAVSLRAALVCAIIWSSAVYSLFASSDSLTAPQVVLPPAEVGIDRPSAAAGLLVRSRTATELRTGALPDIQEALNRLPGVKMESRGIGGSRRISIRGSNARSPFAIRNTFLLADGFVLTSADGVSPFEWLDPQLLTGVEVIAGPTGAFIGGGYGGVVSVTLKPDAQALRFGTSVATLGEGAAGEGPAGGLAAAVALPSRLPTAVRVSAVHQPGYRDQEANRKVQVDVRTTLPSRQGDQTLWIAAWTGRWELPGALDASTATTTPTAAPGAPFSARVERDRMLVGWSREKEGPRGASGVWLLAHGSTKRNPFGTSRFYQGDKHESEGGLTARGRVVRVLHSGGRGMVRADLSAIVRADRLAVTEWDTLAAPQDRSPRYDLLTDALNLWAGAGCDWLGTRGGRAAVGIGMERLDRLTTGAFAAIPDPYRERYSDTRPLLRASWKQPIGKRLAGHAAFAQGIGHPASLELVHPETFLPNTLRSERADGYEAGLQAAGTRWSTDLTLYRTRVVDAIRQVPGSTDAAVLENAAAAALAGAEWEATARGAHWEVRGYAALQQHRIFEADTLLLPGSPRSVVGIDAAGRWGDLRAEVHVRRTGETPLNDVNSDLAEPWSRVDAELSHTFGPWTITAGVRNALDVLYTDWWSVNAPAGRYYNPAAPRTWFLACVFTR
jgi:iron complex outermembrane receptor protein